MQRIMIIEDDPAIREELALLLENEGYMPLVITRFADIPEQAAAEQGAKVIVLEKTAALGGTTLLSGAYYACGNQEVSKKAEMNDKMHEDVEAILALEPKNEDMARWQKTVAKQ